MDLFLVDRLNGLRKQHPGIALEIVTDVRLMSLARREADIALRLGRPPDSGLVGRKLAEVHPPMQSRRAPAFLPTRIKTHTARY